MRIPFAVVLTSLAVILTLLPAILIWVMFSQLLDTSFSELEASTEDSIDTLARSVQGLIVQQAMQVIDVRLTDGQEAMVALQSFVNTTPVASMDLRPTRTDIVSQILNPYRDRNFVLMKSNQLFSLITFQGMVFPNGPNQPGTRLFWNSWQAFDLNPVLQTVGQRTLFLSELLISDDLQITHLKTFYVDQATAQPLSLTQNTTYPALTYPYVIPSGWDNDLGFNSFTGLVQLGGWFWVPCQNDTWVQVSMSVTAYTMSQELLAQLDGYPDDRLYMFFRQPHGHLLAASHGKYWSQSDVDRSEVDPATNPPQISTFVLWTCLNATDDLIHSSCVELYAMYHSWVDIPELQMEMLLGGVPYWVATAHYDATINCTVVMLKNRATVMGAVDASQASVRASVQRRKLATYIVLGVVTTMGAVFLLVLGLWLGHRLLNLSAEMDKIALLRFDDIDAPDTVFSELQRFQTSFLQMERGLRAFSQFVPQAVVKVLMTGRLQAGQHMANETVTVLFADIEGFSGICEALQPQQVADVCTEYFEAMCSEIIDHSGMIDKFIGDCIMALWNAPTPVPNHEVAAVRAALAMQDRVLALHGGWRARHLPPLKFRLGLHSGPALVGNFGCSYRISYTCLGDTVNTAARLEALNKRFGTYLCISEAVFESCNGRFECRRLAKVTLPGKVEIVPVYEVLCRAEGRGGAADPGEDGPDHPSLTIGLDDEDATESKRFRQLYEVRPVPDAEPEVVAWHWALVPRAELLQHGRDHEAAYEALVLGDLPRARRLLQAEPALPSPDKAWAVLREQLRGMGPGAAWDGVFHFNEK